jgi:hypothetical protein
MPSIGAPLFAISGLIAAVPPKAVRERLAHLFGVYGAMAVLVMVGPEVGHIVHFKVAYIRG